MRVKFFAQGNNGAFDGAQTNDWQVSTYHESDALSTAPRHRGLTLLEDRYQAISFTNEFLLSTKLNTNCNAS